MVRGSRKTNISALEFEKQRVLCRITKKSKQQWLTKRGGGSSIFVISLKLSRCINNLISFLCKRFLQHISSAIIQTQRRDSSGCVCLHFPVVPWPLCTPCVCSHIAPSVVALRLVKHVLWEGWWARYHINWWLVKYSDISFCDNVCQAMSRYSCKASSVNRFMNYWSM